MKWSFNASSLRDFYAGLQANPREFRRFRVLINTTKKELWPKMVIPRGVTSEFYGTLVTHAIGTAQVLEMLTPQELDDKATKMGTNE